MQTNIFKIASKLEAEYLTKDNYSTENAIKILSNCVLPTALSKILLENEIEILGLLP